MDCDGMEKPEMDHYWKEQSGASTHCTPCSLPTWKRASKQQSATSMGGSAHGSLLQLSKGVVLDPSVREEPPKRRYILGVVFLWFRSVTDWPWAPCQMCPCGWESGKWSGATPGPVQQAHLTTIIKT